MTLFRHAAAVTPHASNNFARGLMDAFYVGVTGNVVAVIDTPTGEVTVTFTGVPAGAIIPLRCKRINASGTTATNIVGLQLA
jgi:hypothetical protein